MTFRSRSCVVATCNTCGHDAFDSDQGGDFDAVWHFDDEADALKALAEAEWQVAGDGMVTCRRCAEIAACELAGHDWDEWRDLVYERYIGRARRCRTCFYPEYDPPLAAAPGGQP